MINNKDLYEQIDSLKSELLATQGKLSEYRLLAVTVQEVVPEYLLDEVVQYKEKLRNGQD